MLLPQIRQLLCHISKEFFFTLWKLKNMSSQIIFFQFQENKIDGNNSDKISQLLFQFLWSEKICHRKMTH